MRARIAIGVLFVLLASGCTDRDTKSAMDRGTNDAGADGAASDGGPPDGGPSNSGAPIPFITQSWSVEPGNSDYFRCTQVKLHSDVTITGFSNVSSDYNFRTLVTAGATPMNPTDGDF